MDKNKPFWSQFYDKVGQTIVEMEEKGSHGKKDSPFPFDVEYPIFEMMKSRYLEGMSAEELVQLELDIEKMSREMDTPANLEKCYPHIMYLITSKVDTAYSYVLKREKELSSAEKRMLEVMKGHDLSLESILVHVLSELFSNPKGSSFIKIATLIKNIEVAVRKHALVLRMNSRYDQSSTLPPVKELPSWKVPPNDFRLAGVLFDFLLYRGLIYCRNSKLLAKSLDLEGFVVPNFDIRILPLKMNLPMVYPPLDWEVSPELQRKVKKGTPIYELNDMIGGYYIECRGDAYMQKDTLKTSQDVSHLNMIIHNHMPLMKVCNSLQSQAFCMEIHSKDDMINDHGLIRLPLKKLEDLLSQVYKEQKAPLKVKLDYLQNLLYQKVQKTLYEHFLFQLSSAYSKYTFYLPAFLDFLGRIYRPGVLPFHDSDLIKFAYSSDDSLRLPICRVDIDASLLPFHIMSYLLQSQDLGKITNLLSRKGETYDLYTYLQDGLISYLEKEKTSFLPSIPIGDMISLFSIENVKKWFLPLVYGNKEKKIYHEILKFSKNSLGSVFSHKTCVSLAKKVQSFFEREFRGFFKLMELINTVGLFCAAGNVPVRYSTPLFRTVQDYLCSERSEIEVSDHQDQKVRRKVSFRVPTPRKDTGKTKVATFANFIHQKEGQIVMSVVNNFKSKYPETHIYTERAYFFIFPPQKKVVNTIHSLYIRAFLEDLGSPLLILNRFILQNLYSRSEYNTIKKEVELSKPISSELLSQKLNEQPGAYREEGIVKKIVSLYEWYVKTVIGEYNSYEDSWMSFKAILLRESNNYRTEGNE